MKKYRVAEMENGDFHCQEQNYYYQSQWETHKIFRTEIEAVNTVKAWIEHDKWMAAKTTIKRIIDCD